MTSKQSQSIRLQQEADCHPAPAFWILLLVIFLVPLALAPNLQFLEITPKLLILAGGASLVWLALAAGNCLPSARQESSLYFWLLSALALLSLMATAFSSDPVLSLAGNEGRRMGLPSWLACLALAAAVPLLVGNDLRLRRRLLSAMVLAGLIAAIYGCAQYAGYDPWINPELYRAGAGALQTVRPPSTLGHANWFAIFTLLAFFPAIGLALSSPTALARAGWSVSALILVMALVISGSRGAWLGAAIGVVVLYGRIGNPRPLLLGLLAAVILAAALVVSPLGRQLRNRFQDFPDDPGVLARVLVWRDSLRLIAAHPLLGTGPDTYQLGFPPLQSAGLARQAPDYYAESPHNLFLDYLADAGVPAGLIFIALVAMALRKYTVSSRTGGLDAGLMAALAGGLVALQFIGDTISTRLALLAIVGLSFSASIAPARVAVRASVGAVAAVCLFLVILFGSRLAQADRSLFLANRAAGSGDIEAALQEGLQSQRSFPWTGAHAFAFSRIVGQLAVVPGIPRTERSRILAVAEESARAGLLHSAQPQIIYVHLASLLVLEEKQEEAQSALTAAVRTAPVWYRPRWLLAVLLAGQGKLKPAAVLANAALNLGARGHPEIAAACLKIGQLAADAPEPQLFDARADTGLRLSYDHGVVHPHEARSDTPNGRWAFPYQDHSFVTLPQSDLTFAVDFSAVDHPAQTRFRATVRMPLPGADPAWAVVRVNGAPLFNKLLQREQEVNLDLSRFAGQSMELQLAATPTAQGQRAAWVQWVNPRIVIEPVP